MDFRQLFNQIQGSSIIDKAISNIFRTSPIEFKLKEIADLLDNHHNMLDFDYYFDPRSLLYNFHVSLDGVYYEGAIPDETLRCRPVDTIVKEIVHMITLAATNYDLEDMFENENQQAFLDAARDYGFV